LCIGPSGKQGGRVAREAKALVPSVWCWAADRKPPPHAPLLYPQILAQAVRCPDPFVAFKGNWLVRRLAPDCSRIELADLTDRRSDEKLLAAMGRETANIHLDSVAALDDVRRHFKKLPSRWLSDAVEEMRAAVLADWETWKKG
jgi:hypothetical protein